jgi:hypothetical protein
MPANIGEIAGYHSRMAAQYLALAQAAREEGNLTEASYHEEQAARYLQASQEQETAPQQVPGRSAANSAPRRRAPQQKSTPLTTSFSGAVLRGAGQIATAIHRSLFRGSDTPQGLSLHEARPGRAPR